MSWCSSKFVNMRWGYHWRKCYPGEQNKSNWYSSIRHGHSVRKNLECQMSFVTLFLLYLQRPLRYTYNSWVIANCLTLYFLGDFSNMYWPVCQCQNWEVLLVINYIVRTKCSLGIELCTQHEVPVTECLLLRKFYAYMSATEF